MSSRFKSHADLSTHLTHQSVSYLVLLTGISVPISILAHENKLTNMTTLRITYFAISTPALPVLLFAGVSAAIAAARHQRLAATGEQGGRGTDSLFTIVTVATMSSFACFSLLAGQCVLLIVTVKERNPVWYVMIAVLGVAFLMFVNVLFVKDSLTAMKERRMMRDLDAPLGTSPLNQIDRVHGKDVLARHTSYADDEPLDF